VAPDRLEAAALRGSHLQLPEPPVRRAQASLGRMAAADLPQEEEGGGEASRRARDRDEDRDFRDPGGQGSFLSAFSLQSGVGHGLCRLAWSPGREERVRDREDSRRP
jgi:hypothetical protein